MSIHNLELRYIDEIKKKIHLNNYKLITILHITYYIWSSSTHIDLIL